MSMESILRDSGLVEFAVSALAAKWGVTFTRGEERACFMEALMNEIPESARLATIQVPHLDIVATESVRVWQPALHESRSHVTSMIPFLLFPPRAASRQDLVHLCLQCASVLLWSSAGTTGLEHFMCPTGQQCP